MTLIIGALLVCGAATVRADPEASYAFNYGNDVKDEYFQQPVNFMTPKKTPHLKGNSGAFMRPPMDSWLPQDMGKFDTSNDDVGDHNRLKRSPKRVRRFNTINGPKLRERPHHYLYPEPVKDRILEFTTTTKRPSILPDQMNPGVIFRQQQQRKRSRSQRRRGRPRASPSVGPDEEPKTAGNASAVPVARRSDFEHRQKKKSKGKGRGGKPFDAYDPPIKEWESSFVEMPKDLYQAHLRPGVIFRIHMSEAILKMQYRAYGEDKDESVIEADVEYLRLTRKVINDEITKFEDLRWLVGWFSNRSDLIVEHTCNTRYFAVGTPPTMFTHAEEYMKRLCLFDNVYIDHIPYVIGEDSSLMAAVAPPVLHCDASTCTSVPFIDSVMFDEKLARTNVRTVTRCQASCRAHCRNDPDCLKRCSDRCMHGD